MNICLEAVEVKLDKICLICNVDKDHYSNIIQIILDAKTYKGMYGYTYWPGEYWKQCTYPLDNENVLFIKAGYSYGLYVLFEFNPTKLSPEGWENLYLYFSWMFDFGYHSFYKMCRVRSLEIAVDVQGIKFHDVNAVSTNKRIINQVYHPDGTLYLGAERSKMGLTIYDKKKEQFEKKGILLGHELLRIEACLRPNIKLSAIPTITNPFKNLKIFSTQTASLTPGGSVWKQFTKNLTQESVIAQNLYMKLSGPEKSAIGLSMNNACFDWWSPAKHWQVAIGCLSILVPPPEIY